MAKAGSVAVRGILAGEVACRRCSLPYLTRYLQHVTSADTGAVFEG